MTEGQLQEALDTANVERAQLRAENKELRKALERIIGLNSYVEWARRAEVHNIARAALGKKPEKK